eukprot:TRINITY_DN7379_c0_g1_i1.p1 TRINITY_DN7379_c0_g1~~TRINITY_DN7379_c0_g1_i1.p1  ORF type:complete len:773 (+),score=113.77 TRINITY_DN7379_c0_g1_i1:83-2401(+)
MSSSSSSSRSRSRSSSSGSRSSRGGGRSVSSKSSSNSGSKQSDSGIISPASSRMLSPTSVRRSSGASSSDDDVSDETRSRSRSESMSRSVSRSMVESSRVLSPASSRMLSPTSTRKLDSDSDSNSSNSGSSPTLDQSTNILSPTRTSWRSQSASSRDSSVGRVSKSTLSNNSSIKMSAQSPLFSPGSPMSAQTGTPGLLELSNISESPQLVPLTPALSVKSSGIKKKASVIIDTGAKKEVVPVPAPPPDIEVSPMSTEISPVSKPNKMSKALPPPISAPQRDSDATLVCPPASPPVSQRKALPPPSPVKVAPKAFKRTATSSPPPPQINKNNKSKSRYMEARKPPATEPEVKKKPRDPSKIKPAAVHLRLNGQAAELQEKRKQIAEKKQQRELEEMRKGASTAPPEKGKAKSAELYLKTKEHVEKVILKYASKFQSGTEVRAIRTIRPSCVGESHSRFRDNLKIEEGATCRVLESTKKRLSRTKPRSVLWDEARSTTLINSDDSCEFSARNIFVWVACQGFEALVRADCLMPSHNAAQQLQITTAIQDFETLGAQFLGRLDAQLHSHLKSLPKAKAWHEVSKHIDPVLLDETRQKYPKGAIVTVAKGKGSEEGEIRGYTEDGDHNVTALRILMTDTGLVRKIPADMFKTVALKKRPKQKNIDIAHIYDKHSQAQAKISEKRAKMEAETIKECTFRPNIRHPHTGPLSKEDIKESVLRLNEPTKCQNRDWVESECKKKENDENRQIEFEKRQANRTYDALQTWKERWEDSMSR